MEWMILPLRRYAQFAGRSRRKEYWMFVLLMLIAYAIAMTLDSMLGLGGTTKSYSDLSATGASAGFNSTGGILTVIVALALLVPGLAVTIRRLHDVDKSGWFVLIGFIPFGAFYLIYLYVQPGTPGANRFGPDPMRDGFART